MDEITEYLAFMPTHARATGEAPGDTPVATPGSSGDASMHDDEQGPAGSVRDLLADPKVLAALLRLARS